MARQRFLTWPNRLTMLRIILIAPFVVMLLNIQNIEWYWARHGALAIFVIMVVTDLLDGYLARRFHQESPLGRFLDPLADKFLVTCAMILLGLESTAVPRFQIPSWVVVAAIGKDVFVVVGFILVFMVTGRVFIRPGWTGKLCTDTQMVLVLVILVGPDAALLGQAMGTFVAQFQVVLWWVATVLAIVTCWHYYGVGAKFAHDVEKQKLS